MKWNFFVSTTQAEPVRAWLSITLQIFRSVFAFPFDYFSINLIAPWTCSFLLPINYNIRLAILLLSCNILSINWTEKTAALISVVWNEFKSFYLCPGCDTCSKCQRIRILRLLQRILLGKMQRSRCLSFWRGREERVVLHNQRKFPRLQIHNMY